MIKQRALKVALLGGLAVAAGGLGLQPAPAEARIFVGVGVGPYWGSPWYPAPYYYAPPPVVYAPPPVVYAPPPVQPAYVAPHAQYWYYCDNPAGYYPTVPSCSTQWHQVPAQAQ